MIDWRSFDIEADESTQFHQPSSGAIALNRVNSPDPSNIAGRLSANGNIVLVNPNGIFFDGSAKVDVNGLIATSADIETDAFMKGSNHFNIPGAPTATIVNEGTITAKDAGLVGLVAPNVVNQGVISAKLGRAHLASGDTLVADFYGDGLLKIEITDEEIASQLVANTGTIKAEGGTIAITAAAARKTVNSLVVAEGELKAPTVEKRGGKIIIAAAGSNKTAKTGDSNVVVRGNLDASGRSAGEQGGQIDILGDHIAILDGAVIDASGSNAPIPAGENETATATLTADKEVRSEDDFLAHQNRAGGSIKIGGDYLGSSETQTAKTLYVSDLALTVNDALLNGDAGRTIFWSDKTTDFNGTVLSRGGIDGGHGGFLETSGKHDLNANGFADLRNRANGYNKGTYLLDPADITIFGNTDSAFTDASLSGHWDFEGTASDQSGAGKNGAVKGATFTANAAPTPQMNTGSMSFDGNNDFIALNDSFSGTNSLANFSVSAWVNTTYSGGAFSQNWSILDYDRSEFFNFYVQPNGQLGFSTNSAGKGKGIHDMSAGANANDGSWHHVTAVYDGTDKILYLDGEEVGRVNNPHNGQGLGKGRRYGFIGDGSEAHKYNGKRNNIYYKGLLDDIRFYNTNLTPNNINELKGNNFTVDGLEFMSQTADIALQADNSITLDLQGDTLNLDNNRSISLTATNGSITDTSAGRIMTNNGDISLNAGSHIALDTTALDATNGGQVHLNAAGDIDLLQNSTLNLGQVDGDAISLRTTTADADIILNDTVTAADTGNALTLTAGGNFTNNYGTGALNANNGRFLVYSTAPAADTRSHSFDFKRYNKTYGDNPPITVTEAGNGFLYSIAPTLTVTADDSTRQYGDANVFSYAIGSAGFIDGDTTAKSGAVNGSATLSSSATLNSDTGSYTINAALGSLSSELGYQFTGFNSGTLTINKAPLNISLAQSDYSRRHKAPNPSFNLNYSGFKLSDTATVLDSRPQAGTTANRTSPAGQYEINISGGLDNNYAFSYSNPAGQMNVSGMDLPSSWENTAYNSGGNTGSFTVITPTPSTSTTDSNTETGTAETEENQSASKDDTNDNENKNAASPNSYEEADNDENSIKISGLNVRIDKSLARILGFTQQKFEALFR